MDIMSYFHTTNKGIHPMSTLPKTTTLTRSFFGMSLGLQIMFLLVFIAIFGLSIYRSVKKIKNPKFRTDKEEDAEDEEQNVEDQTNAKETNDNLIYRFDEEDHEKEKKFEGEDEQKKGQEQQQNSDDEYEKQHDENEGKFLEIDNKILFVQPFLIGHIVCNSIFTTNFISLGLMAATIILYIVFNIKNVCENSKVLSIIFMLPAIGSFVPVFISDHDMST